MKCSEGEICAPLFFAQLRRGCVVTPLQKENQKKNLHSIVLPAIQLAMHPFPANGLEQERRMVQPIKKNLKNILYLISLGGQSENLAS
jgi:hypothetical protein